LFFPILMHGVGIPNLHWIRLERVDNLMSFFSLEEMFSVFPHVVEKYATGLSYIDIIMLRYSLCIPSFLRTYIMKRC
jgi:hypothetical protein